MTLLNRRRFLGLNAAAVAGAALAPRPVAASGAAVLPDPAKRGPEPDAGVAPGFYRFQDGEAEVTVFSDGHFHFPMELVPIDDPIELQAADVDAEVRESYFRSRMVPFDHLPLQVSPVLISSPRGRVLVDTGFGAGPESPPTAGRLLHSLDAAGVPAEGIDQVVLTHAHPDHLGGLLDPETGAMLFPEAEVVISDEELAFWTEGDMAGVPDWLVSTARTVLDALGDRLRTVSIEEEVFPGILSIPSPGHTPGHISVAVDTGARQLLLVGDAVVFTHASFEHPEWHVFTDVDRDQAGRTRRRLLDRAATDEMLILGFHFPFPGIGFALEYRDAFRWHAAGWTVLTARAGRHPGSGRARPS